MYYVEPSIAMKMSSFNGLNNSSQNATTVHATLPPPTTSNHSSNNHITKAKLELKNVENNNIKLYTNGNTQSPVVDPFAPSQPQSSFANFDNATIFNATSTVPGTGNVMMSTNTSSSSINVPTEDRYAALKDLDTIMKSQKQLSNGTHEVGSPIRSTTLHTAPVHPTAIHSTDPWGNTLGSSPPVNGGLWNQQPMKENGHINIMNGFTSNPFANDTWGSENNINMDSTSNPFKNSKLFSDWPGTNGQPEMTTSQSMSTFQWMSQANASRPNPFAANGFSGSPPNNSAYHSSNPFL